MHSKEKGEALAADTHAMREVGQALQALEAMNLAELRERHQELYGAHPQSKNLPYLRKRLAFRIQERVEGGLTAFARQQLEALAPVDLPVRKAPVPRRVLPHTLPPAPRDPRLPAAGTRLRREHLGFLHEVDVEEQGFVYKGRPYRSLSAIAREITGTAWNGFLFFGLTGKGGSSAR